MVDINKFSQELVCKFKDRTYSVRDNGSVYRHQKEGSRPAPLDNKWTFGKKDAVTGYMMLAGVRVHQIVLNNPYTRSRIAFLCGSVEAFLKDPSILRQTASEPKKGIAQQRSEIEAETIRYEEEQLALKDSLTPGAKQLDWKTPTEFPLCPQTHTATPLQDYPNTLVKGQTFCKNQYYHSEVVKAEIAKNGQHLAVITTTSGVTNFALTEIRYEKGFYIHESIRTFFSEESAEKYY